MKHSFAPLAVVAFLAASLFGFCRHEGRPADVLDAPQMVAFLTDAYLLEGFYAVETQYRYDALSPEVLRAYDDILSAHHLTREQVEHSFDYYANHPDLYRPIQDSVFAILERQSEADTAAAASKISSVSPTYLQI